jgi:hypothetical protein
MFSEYPVPLDVFICSLVTMNPPKFRVVKTATSGRALVATSDIAPSQLIVTDHSSVVAPITHTDDFLAGAMFCVACFKFFNKVLTAH